MKQYAIVKRIDNNSNCPGAYLLSCIRTQGHRGVLDIYESKEQANYCLFELAKASEEEENDSVAAIYTAKNWGLFCANVAKFGNMNTQARTNGLKCRYYHDSDVQGFAVVPVQYDVAGEIDYIDTMNQF